MIRVLINGILGRMGSALCKTAEEAGGFTVAGGVDRFDRSDFPYPVFRSFDDVDVPFDVIIDFSLPDALEAETDFVRSHPVPLVVGTTGLSERHLRLLKNLSQNSPVFSSGNMSLGVNLQANLASTAAAALGTGFDIEIVERHHRTKVDSPSGTALLLADAISGNSSTEYDYVFGRHEKNKRRTDHEIGFHSVRGGTIVGEHEVSFIGNDEVVTITHQAFSKRVFAEGALRAAAYLMDKKNGFYNMQNLVTEQDIASHVSVLPGQAVIHLEFSASRPDFPAEIFRSVSDRGVIVDMISFSGCEEGTLSLAFSVPDVSLSDALKTVRKLSGISGISMEGNLSKITVEGTGMALHKGIAANVFTALSRAGIRVLLITTSETQIEFCVHSADADSAVQALDRDILD